MKPSPFPAFILAVALVLASFPALLVPDSVWAQTTPPVLDTDGKPEVRPDELLVKFRPGSAAPERAAVHQQVGGTVVREIPGLDVQVIRVPERQLQNRLRGYQANPNVEYAELNGMAYAVEYPNDTHYPQQWGLNNNVNTKADISAPGAWKTGATGNTSVRIAILDSGVRGSHEDLATKVDAITLDDQVHGGNNLKWYRNWTTTGNGSHDADDGHGHGTHVAGIASAVTNSPASATTSAGIAGVCPDCLLTIGKVLADDGGGAYDWIANGILWAVGCEIRDSSGNCQGPQRAQVINLSLGGTFNSITLQDAVNKAWSRGAVLTCAAGNSGTSARFYPAYYTNCIAVAATNNQDQKASWSNFGKWVDVAAPGVDTLSTLPMGDAMNTSPTGYTAWSGTSMASPHVAGLAALLWAKGGSLLDTPSEVRAQLENTADRIAGTGNQWSRGRINACKAVGGATC
jgi:thermitase